MNSVCRRPSVGLKLCAKRLSELCALCERKPPSQQFSNVLFLTENTDEQNTQRPTETLSQPITQNITATEASPPAPLRMERGVVCEVTPFGLLAWGVVRSFSHVGEFFLSQSTQSSRSFLAHVSSPQKAFGIQRTQRPFN